MQHPDDDDPRDGSLPRRERQRRSADQRTASAARRLSTAAALLSLDLLERLLRERLLDAELDAVLARTFLLQHALRERGVHLDKVV